MNHPFFTHFWYIFVGPLVPTATFPKDSFDFVLCIEACASFEKPELFVQGAASVLRPGGRLLLADALERKTSIKILDALEDNGCLANMATNAFSDEVFFFVLNW